MDLNASLVLFIRNTIREIMNEDFRYEYNRSEFHPPSDVIGTAKRALEIVSKYKKISHGGNEGSGLQKAKTLSSGEPMNHEQLKRMKSFFDKNHEKVKQEISSGKNIYNSELVQKWELWGGDAGMRWVNSQIDSTQETNKTSKKLRPKGTKNLMDPYNTRKHDKVKYYTMY